MEYKAAVAEARRLDHVIEEAEATAEQAMWDRAKLCAQVLDGGVSTRQWAKDIEKDPSTVSRWAILWRRFGVADHHGYTYGEAWEIVSHPDYKLNELPPGEVFTGRRNEQARRTVRNLPPEQKAAVAREVVESLPPEQAASVASQALRQPEVADRVLRDKDARRTVRDADDRYHVDHQREAKDREELTEPRSVQIGAMTAGEYDLTKARRGFEDALDNAETLERHGWPDESRERFTALTRRAMAAGEALLAKLEGRDLDRELAELLREDG